MKKGKKDVDICKFISLDDFHYVSSSLSTEDYMLTGVLPACDLFHHTYPYNCP